MTLPYPAVTPENAFFWLSGKEDKLRFQRCTSCTTFIHPPKPRCPECLSEAIEIVDVSGRATVSTYTVNYHEWHPDLPPPYVIAIVAIDEAPYVRLTTRLVNCEPGRIAFGMPVRVAFARQGPVWLPLFEPERA